MMLAALSEAQIAGARLGAACRVPDHRHSGADAAILTRRGLLYERAQRQTPGRWSSRIRNWTPVATVVLNPEPTAEGLNASF